MKAVKEVKVKKAVTDLLKERGVYYFYPIASGYSLSGIPDIICCYKGVMIGIEVKAGKNKPTKLQEEQLSKIRKAGGRSLWVNEKTVHKIHEVLDALDSEWVDEEGHTV